MRALDKKLLRDLGHMRAQAAAIALVGGVAVALFVGLVTMYQSVRISRHHYYVEHRFADLWSTLERAPQSVARDLAALPRVAAVADRIRTRAILDIPNVSEPASAVVTSIPAEGEQPLDKLYIRRGRMVDPESHREVMVNEAFSERNDITPGSFISAIIAGQQVSLRVVGIAMSPEYVMAIPPGALINDDRRFAVLWMQRNALEALVGLRSAFNDVAIKLVPGTNEDSVATKVDGVLERYGGRGTYGRDAHPSHTMLEEHLSPLAPLSVLVPSIFLLAAAFLVNMVLSRIIATQREQVGMLKAFGYSNAALALHYLKLTLAIVLLGIALGIPSGIWLGREMALFYGEFFRFPVLIFRVELSTIALGAGLAIVAAVLGVLRSLRRVSAIPPITAMSSEVPAFRRSLLGKIPLLARVIPALARMILRNLMRRPIRSSLTCLGMALAVAVVVLGESSADGTNRMRDVSYQAQQRADMEVTLAHPRNLATLHELAALPGVRRAEPFRSIPARLFAAGGSKDIVLYGLERDAILRRVVDNSYRTMEPPRDGVIVTKWIARRFRLRRGDNVALELRQRQRRVVTTRVVGVVDEPMGLFAYIDLRSLDRLIREPKTFSGVHLDVDPMQESKLNDLLKHSPSAIAIGYRRSSLLSYREMSDAATEFIRRILIVFSVIIAFGMVYNTARITLSERSRELATMRVIGFTRAEISRVLLGEIGLLALPAIPLGLVLGYLLTGAVAASASGARFHMPWLVSAETYGFSILVFLIAATVSALIVRRRLDRLDLIAVLKARE